MAFFLHLSFSLSFFSPVSKETKLKTKETRPSTSCHLDADIKHLRFPWDSLKIPQLSLLEISLTRFTFFSRTWKTKHFKFGYQTFQLFAYFLGTMQSNCQSPQTHDVYLLCKLGILVFGYSERHISHMQVKWNSVSWTTEFCD